MVDLVSLQDVRVHLQELERIADEHGGNRAAGTPGHEASVDYVTSVLEDAGYAVRRQEFSFAAFDDVGPDVVELVPAGATSFASGEDFKAMLYSASGDVTAPLVAVGFDVDAHGLVGLGCDLSDFDGFPEGAVALVQAGPCFRRDQVTNAQTAGASAVIVSYPDWTAGAVRRPTLIDPTQIKVPALSASHEVGVVLSKSSEQPGTTVHVAATTTIEERTTVNVIAETKQGDPGAVIMAGGHLDSTIDGPGINDNASGTATLLAIAELLSDPNLDLEHRVRFAFWSAEELGLLGSTEYVDTLSGPDRDAILAYLNFDMLASPNHAVLVYGEPDAPSGSTSIAERFEVWFEAEGVPSERFDLGGGSDHGPFARMGIPVGGLFAGASELMTDQQATRYGGTAGEPHDECYHLACDRLDHVGEETLDTLSEAAAQVILALAREAEPLP